MTNAVADAGKRRRIVVGVDDSSGGRSARRLLHGSVSGYCRKHAHCPVVVVPAGGQS